MHDTFAKRLREAFPEATYLLPPGFPLETAELAPAERLRPASLPEAWHGEIEIERVRGVSAVEEHALLHRVSSTLVLSDLVFNLALPSGGRIPFFLRWVSGIKAFPATSRLVKLAVRDKVAVAAAVKRILAWEFERVVVGHGQIMDANAKDLLKRTLSWAIGKED